ncbi:PBAN-type neuropeptides [Cephus cinctus]|uniref:PBAN-type neuropeptides n=1 Tax=Cephus cinctus TaxID=211228 RepID=A0AAJ7C337_CEPCN|nr:PBAN-type neuropeptides [Cephus cinctus]
MILFTKHLCAAVSLALLITCISAEYDTKEVDFTGNGGRANEANGVCSGSSCVKRTFNGVSGAMWFGPRLGRRRRSDEKSEADVDEINAIAEALNAAPWALVSIPEGKRHAMQVFTPRLGRELAEDYLLYNSLNGAAQGGSQDDVEQRSPPFAPRLGRRLPFMPSPRLGRQLRAFLRKV